MWGSRGAGQGLVAIMVSWAIAAVSPAAAAGEAPPVHAAGRGGPELNLRDGVDLPARYGGPPELLDALAAGRTRPLALASADLDEDGMPDVVAGYALDAGGALSLHRGNVDLLFPHTVAAQQRRGAGHAVDAAFLPDAPVVALPEAPDTLGAGDLDADGHPDVIAGAIGSTRLWLLGGDGRGGFGAPVAIDLGGGALTALAVGELGRFDGRLAVIAAVDGPGGPRLLVFSGLGAAVRAAPLAVPLPWPATSLWLGSLDDDPWIDLAATAGAQVLVLRGWDRNRLRPDFVPALASVATLPCPAASVLGGDFLPAAGPLRRELAVLGSDGAVRVLERSASGAWTLATTSAALAPARDPAAPGAARLVATRLTARHGEELVLLDPAGGSLQVLEAAEHRQLGLAASLDLAGEPAAVLPMRLNIDNRSDLVVLQQDRTAPAVALTAATFTFDVNDVGDAPDARPGDDQNLCDTAYDPQATPPVPPSGICTLRAAIMEASQSSGTDEIDFRIASGHQIIRVDSQLSSSDTGLVFDGTTQPGFQDQPIVEIRFPGTYYGLDVDGGVARGLVFNETAKYEGVFLSSDSILEGSYSGTDYTGTVGMSNDHGGVFIMFDSANVVVGGTTAAARNLISGNTCGICTKSNTTGTKVLGNYIGTDVTGKQGLGNSSSGISLALPTNAQIGGTGTGEGNVIAASGFAGISLHDGSGAKIQGNRIGTNAEGTAALGNYYGIRVSGHPDVPTSHSIGGDRPAGASCTGPCNLISASTSAGIEIRYQSDDNTVEGNLFGTAANGTDLAGNSNAVTITDSKDNTIGGKRAAGAYCTGVCNVIANSTSSGIIVQTGTGNAILGNEIRDNGRTGIDLGNYDGITANDPDDPDTGPNDLQNFPTVDFDPNGGELRVNLQGKPNATFRVEVFSNTECEGTGQGRTLVGARDGVTTDAEGNASFTFTPGGSAQFYSATATDAANNTSELTPCPLDLNGIEVTQAIQNWDNAVPLIEGRPTAVRVHLRSPEEDVSGVYAELLVKSGETTLRTLVPSNSPRTITVLAQPWRGSISDGFYFDIPTSCSECLTGTVTFEVRSGASHSFACQEPKGGNDTSQGSDCKVTLTFEPSPAPLVFFRDVVWSASPTGPVYAPALTDYLQVQRYIEAQLPVPRLNAVKLPVPLLWPLFGAPVPFQVDLLQIAGYSLSLLRFSPTAILHSVIVGEAPGGQLGDGSLGLFDLPQYLLVGRISTAYGLAGPYVAPHELGHNFSLRHRYCFEPKGPKPDNFVPPEYNCRIGPEPSGFDDPTAFYGFDVRELNSEAKVKLWNVYDLMGYQGELRWIQDVEYKAAHDYIVQNLRGAEWPATPIEQRAPQQVLLVAGSVDPSLDTGQIGLFYELEAPELPESPPSGAYAVRLEDSSGTALASYSFDPIPLADGSNRLFSLIVPPPAGLARVVLLHDGKELDVRTPSDNSPSVGVPSPVVGDGADGVLQLSWTASDPDGDSLRFLVEYSADGGETWELLTLEWTATTLEVPLALLPGTGQGAVRVYATDGFHTVMGQTAATFAVPTHAPQAKILAPVDDSCPSSNQLARLEGGAFDPEDGVLPDAALSWSSGKSGVLGTGAMLEVDGISFSWPDTITLTATDSESRTASASITVNPESGCVGEHDLTAAPLALGFQAAPGGPSPASLELALRKLGWGTELAWTATADQLWIQLGAASGTTPGNLTVTVDSTGKAEGIYSGTITVTAAQASMGSPRTINVELQVSSASALPLPIGAPALLALAVGAVIAIAVVRRRRRGRVRCGAA
ncbi:MAG: hypothetical protein HYV63_12870 [Candidatus Schekmanbacteria bacterium]|nr:hypothetical protein [Candidatus Schekmanbacteria bacterium]